MDAYFHIPKPCNENWDNMLAADQGRHCLQCSTTVIDFTDWEAPEIAVYLETHAATKVCGLLRKEQLDIPVIEAVQQIYYANISMLKKIAAVFLTAFGLAVSSCTPVSVTKIQTSNTGTVTKDTVFTKGRVLRHKPEPDVMTVKPVKVD
jgi:hypothetical protein